LGGRVKPGHDGCEVLYRALTEIAVVPAGWAVRSVWAWVSMSVVIRQRYIAAI